MSKQQVELTLAADVQGIGKAGERVSLMLTPADVHDASEMPTYLAGYKPANMRADEACPIVLVDNDTDKYRQFDADDAFRIVDVATSDTAPPALVDPKSSTATYKVVNYAAGAVIPRQTQTQASGNYDPVFAALRRCRRAIDLAREHRVFRDILGTISNWTSTVRTAIVSPYHWNGGASSDPIKDLESAIEKSYSQPSAIWLNQKVAHTFLRHDKVRDHMRQMMGDAAQAGAILAVNKASDQNIDFQIPGLPPIRVVATKYRTDSSSAPGYIMPDYAVLVTVPPGVPTDGEEIASAYTFRRRGPSGTGFEVRQFDLEQYGPLGATMVVVSHADDEVMTGPVCGGIISGIIA